MYVRVQSSYLFCFCFFFLFLSGLFSSRNLRLLLFFKKISWFHTSVLLGQWFFISSWYLWIRYQCRSCFNMLILGPFVPSVLSPWDKPCSGHYDSWAIFGIVCAFLSSGITALSSSGALLPRLVLGLGETAREFVWSDTVLEATALFALVAFIVKVFGTQVTVVVLLNSFSDRPDGLFAQNCRWLFSKFISCQYLLLVYTSATPQVHPHPHSGSI